MQFRARSYLFALVLLATTARAQDPTLFAENFEAGLPASWQVTGSGTANWHLAAAGECGAVTKMMAVNGGAAQCSLAGGANSSALLSPRIALTPSPAWHLSFDYILDIDATGDELSISAPNASSQQIVFATKSDLVSDGQLHSVALEIPSTLAGGLIPPNFLFLLTWDGVGDQGRGWLIDNVRVSRTPAGAAYCAGQVASSCPCSNVGGFQRGCANSTGIGVALHGVGTPSVSGDTYQLTAVGLPANAIALFYAGTAQANVVFGDGRRCVGGTRFRLATKSSSSHNSAYPEPTESRLSTLLAPAPGSTWHHQVIYRDPSGPCASGFNLSNGWSVTWAP